jgi:hypothetical protein
MYSEPLNPQILLPNHRDMPLPQTSPIISSVCEELTFRISRLKEDFKNALVISSGPGINAENFITANSAQTVSYVNVAPYKTHFDPSLYFPAPSKPYDLIVSVLHLNWLSHIREFLDECRNQLESGGLFLGVIGGEETLRELREVLKSSDEQFYGGCALRVLPTILVKDMGMLLQKCGFQEPLSDKDRITLNYPDLRSLLNDLQNEEQTYRGVKGRSFPPLTPNYLSWASKCYEDRYPFHPLGIKSTLDLVYSCGWKAD